MFFRFWTFLTFQKSSNSQKSSKCQNSSKSQNTVQNLKKKCFCLGQAFLETKKITHVLCDYRIRHDRACHIIDWVAAMGSFAWATAEAPETPHAQKQHTSSF